MSIVSDAYGARWEPKVSSLRLLLWPWTTCRTHCTEALHTRSTAQAAIVRASLALADAIAAIAIAADKTQHCHSHSIAAK